MLNYFFVVKNFFFSIFTLRKDEDDGLRYSETDAQGSVNGITAGIKKWSQRYLAECGGQANHLHIVKHANKWRTKLSGKVGTC